MRNAAAFLLLSSLSLTPFHAADRPALLAEVRRFAPQVTLAPENLDSNVIAGHYTENGPERLAGGKRVIVALARGGMYDAGSPAAALEHLETYLRGIFNFIGIEPEFVAADGLNFGPEQRQAALNAALGETMRLAA